MARAFGGTAWIGTLSAASYLSGSSGPFTIAGWFKPANLTQSVKGLIYCGNVGGTLYWHLRWEGVNNSIDFAMAGGGSGSPGASSAIELTSSHVTNGAYFAYRYAGASGAWDKFLNGAKTTINPSITFTLPTLTSSRFAVGTTLGTSQYLDGAVAEIAIWNAALSDDDIREIASGVSARAAVRGGLLCYYPLRGTQMPEINYMDVPFGSSSSALFVGVGTTAQAPHPDTVLPLRRLPPESPERDMSAWVLEVRHPTGTRRVASVALSDPIDVDIVGAAPPGELKNAHDIEVVEEFTDGVGGFDVPSTVTVLCDNTKYRSVPASIRPSLLDPALIARDPVAWWRCNDATGPIVDQIGVHDASVIGSLTRQVDGAYSAAGDRSTGVQFPGSAGNYAQAAEGSTDDFKLGVSGTPFAIAFWAKLTNTSQTSKYVLDRLNRWSVIYGYSSQRYEFFAGTGLVGDDPRTGSQITVSDTSWHHIVYTYGGGLGTGNARWAGYLDGVKVFELAKNFQLGSTTSAVFFASAGGGSNFWLGSCQDVALYRRALTDAEVLAMYQAGAGQLGWCPGVRYHRTPAVLYFYDRATHTYSRAISGMVVDQHATADGNFTLTLSTHDQAKLQLPIPTRTVNVDEFPSATALGAPVPVVFGAAMLTAPACGADEENSPGGLDFLVANIKDADSTTTQLDIEDVYFDAAPSNPGLEKAAIWQDLNKAITYVSTTTFRVSGDVTNQAVVGWPVRVVTTATAGVWRVTYIVSATYSSPNTTITVADAILDSGINTNGCIDEIAPAPSAGGTGYTVGDLLTVTTGGTNGRVRVIRVSSGVVQELRLEQPGVGYTTGSGKATSGGTGSGCTVHIRSVSRAVQYATEVLVEKTRYTSGGKACASVRLLMDYDGGVVVRARNRSIDNPAYVASEVLRNGTWGLGESVVATDVAAAAALYTAAGQSIAYALGGDGQQQSAIDFLRGILSLRGGRIRYDPDQLAWRITADDVPPAARLVLGYGDGIHNNIKASPSFRPRELAGAISQLVVRYGPTGRISASDEGSAYMDLNGFRYSLQKAVIGTGAVLVVTLPFVGDHATASRFAQYQATMLQCLDQQLDNVTTGPSGSRAELGGLVRIKVPRLGLDEDMRVIRKARRLHETTLSLCRYDAAAYSAPTGITYEDGLGKLTQADAADLRETESTPGTLLARMANADFSAALRTSNLSALDIIPGWMFIPGDVTAMGIVASPSTVGGQYLEMTVAGGGTTTLTPLSTLDPAWYSTVVMAVIPGKLYLPSIYAEDTSGAMSIWVRWYTAGGSSLSSDGGKVHINYDDRNGLGWPRQYAVVRAPQGAARAEVNYTFSPASTSTFRLDAAALERAGRRTIRPGVWRRNADWRIDPAVMAPGNLRIRTGNDFDHATSAGIKTWLMNLPASGTTLDSGVSSTQGIEAGMALESVTCRVTSALGGTCTSWSCGVSLDPHRFASAKAKSIGTTSEAIVDGGGSFVPGDPFATAMAVRLTANGGSFNGGQIRVSLHWRKAIPPSA